MGYSNAGADDWEKLQQALGGLGDTFGSVQNIMEAFGLAELPTAQRYGIVFGICTFTLTVTTVLTLLIWGGSFKRIKEQAQSGQPTLLSAHEARQQRALLLEQLLESREWMQQRNYNNNNKNNSKTTTTTTPLTTMLLNVTLQTKVSQKDTLQNGIPPALDATERSLYEDNFKLAYRTCQEHAGGKTLPGRFEARPEAYARAYAGCGSHVTTAYRRSYARLYEATACATHKTDDQFVALYKERPQDLIGRYVRLEALSTERHLDKLFEITTGEPLPNHKSYDPNQVWGFLPQGPFANKQEMSESYLFRPATQNQAFFAIIQNVTGELLGVVAVSHDDPINLSIQLDAPIVQPQTCESQHEMEACFLLLDRLFAYGYRRIQLATDSQDALTRKLANRLGFTLEGVLYKHLIVKEASRDSNIYGLLNSDWKRGARSALFGKLYGKAALKADKANEAREAEQEERARELAEKKLQEEAEAKK